ncbi:hypothetical protein AAJCM20276_13410 [Acetobacter aceti]|uniref:Uncharacterized protein n=2 Tax=Acetobacter aceti TaxID=435 RepID=A0A6S6PD20_ACEAC|nr:hypothetical protein AAJCM20276_13410 [Acetobacter aceti]
MQAMKVLEIRKILKDARIQENWFIESDKGHLVRNPIFDKLTKLIIALPYIFDQDHEFPSNLEHNPISLVHIQRR